MNENDQNIDINAQDVDVEDTPIPEMAKPKRRWIRQIAFSLLILFCGAAIGSAVTLNVVWKRFVEGFQRPEEISGRVLNRMKWTLELTHEQEKQISEIFREHERTIRELRMEYQPLIHAEMDSLQEELKDILTPEQIEIWDERFRGMERMWMGPRQPGGGPPGRGMGRGFRGGEGGPPGRGFRGGDGSPPERERRDNSQ